MSTAHTPSTRQSGFYALTSSSLLAPISRSGSGVSDRFKALAPGHIDGKWQSWDLNPETV